MKKTSKMMCLALVVLLVACMAVPAMAASGTGTHGQYYYTWTLTRTDTSGRAAITTPYAPTTVGAAVQNDVHGDNGEVGFAYSQGSLNADGQMAPITGYASSSATASNVFIFASRQCTGTVVETHGYFWVNGTRLPVQTA